MIISTDNQSSVGLHMYLGIPSNSFMSIGSSKRHILLDRQVLILIDCCLAYCDRINKAVLSFMTFLYLWFEGLILYRGTRQAYSLLSLEKLRTEVFQGLFPICWFTRMAKEKLLQHNLVHKISEFPYELVFHTV